MTEKSLTSNSNHQPIQEVLKIQEYYKKDSRRFYLLTRHTDKYKDHDFKMIFARELLAYCTDSDNEQNIITLIPLYSWLQYLGINLINADQLLEGFLGDNCRLVNTTINTEFIEYANTGEFSYVDLGGSDQFTIYLIPERETLENIAEANGMTVSLEYISLVHLEAFEYIFTTYSKLVELNLFKDPKFIEVWKNYLNLMQENALADNLEGIHTGFWFSLSPELTNIANTTKGLN